MPEIQIIAKASHAILSTTTAATTKGRVKLEVRHKPPN